MSAATLSAPPDTGVDVPVEVLADHPSRLHARLLSLDANHLQIQVEEPLMTGLLIQANINGSLLLGEVVFCTRSLSQLWNVFVRVEHALVNRSRLHMV